MDRRDQRRALYEAILSDPAASHLERLKADDALRELEREDAALQHVERQNLSPGQVAQELEAFGMPGASAVQAGPDGVAPALTVVEQLYVAEENERLAREDADRAFAERAAALADRDDLKRVAREAFEALLGEEEPDAEAVLAAWRLVHSEDAVAEDERDGAVRVDELPAGGDV